MCTVRRCGSITTPKLSRNFNTWFPRCNCRYIFIFLKCDGPYFSIGRRFTTVVMCQALLLQDRSAEAIVTLVFPVLSRPILPHFFASSLIVYGVHTMFSNEHLRIVLEKYVSEAVDEMQRRIRSADLVMTGEMLSSFRVASTETGKDYIAKQISMVDYVRIRDLRSMHYVRTPPLDSMEYFVKSMGVHRFYYVPGYENGNMPADEDIAVRRIAWAIKMSIKRKPDVKRGYRGIYSASVRKAMMSLKSRAGQAGASFAIKYVKETLTK